MEDYDLMVEVEEALEENLGSGSEVDGHDAGSGEVNIFIHTDNPETTFNEVRTVLKDKAAWADARIAYRETSKSDYTILWPKNLTKFKVG